MSESHGAPTGHMNLQQIADGQTGPGEPSPRRPRMIGLPFSWGAHLVIMVVTVTYLAIEWRYNIRLMQILGDANLPTDAMDSYALLGRVLAAFGLTWALLRPVAALTRGAATQLLVFGGMWVCVLFGLNMAHNALAEGVDTPEARRSAMATFQYRQDLLAGEHVEADLPAPSTEPAVGPVMMVGLPVMAWDDAWMQDAIGRMEQRARDEVDKLRAAAAEHWPLYQRVQRSIDELFAEYQHGSALVQSRDFHFHAVNSFRTQTGGMSPRVGTSRETFVSHQIPRSSLPEAKQIEQSLQRVIMTDTLGRSFRLGDVPPSMNRREYDQWVDGAAEAIVLEINPPLNRISGLDHVDEIASTATLPPAAMTLSIVAMVLNAGALLAQILTAGAALLASRWWKTFALVTGLTMPIGVVVAATYCAGPSAYDGFPRVLEAEQRMVNDLGAAGQAWARAGAVQQHLNAAGMGPAESVDAFFDQVDGAIDRLQSDGS